MGKAERVYCSAFIVLQVTIFLRLIRCGTIVLLLVTKLYPAFSTLFVSGRKKCNLFSCLYGITIVIPK